MPAPEQSVFGRLPDGREVRAFTLANDAGARVRLCEWGATVLSIEVPDSAGLLADVVLGFDALEGYLGPHPHVGATVGRYANRIARGRFRLDGTTYELATNDGLHHLHGGPGGLGRALWSGQVAGPDRVRFEVESPDGDQGYPGRLSVSVSFRWTGGCALVIDYVATTSAPTPVSLTHHGYFNLAGHAGGDVLDHELELAAEGFLPVDADLIPTGVLEPVAGGVFDRRTPAPIGRGYDHCFALAEQRRSAPAFAARVRDPGSGRVLEVETTEPGLQLYTANGFDGSLIGRQGVRYRRHGALCLEAQSFPDAPNRAHFPDPTLRPGETYRQTTVYRFGSTD